MHFELHCRLEMLPYFMLLRFYVFFEETYAAKCGLLYNFDSDSVPSYLHSFHFLASNYMNCISHFEAEKKKKKSFTKSIISYIRCIE